ncbi:hypothetical protein HZH66_014185 [Vespula vulgaris]|uniref:Uncharacterized protein n=1 Tax=Vespula vulgaris TaxID=7454 RepID=A0A834MRB6_VESVU|nr:hypothetical protein HZH66_014185 [Vespula vulgaris]
MHFTPRAQRNQLAERDNCKSPLFIEVSVNCATALLVLFSSKVFFNLVNSVPMSNPPDIGNTQRISRLENCL